MKSCQLVKVQIWYNLKKLGKLLKWLSNLYPIYILVHKLNYSFKWSTNSLLIGTLVLPLHFLLNLVIWAAHATFVRVNKTFDLCITPLSPRYHICIITLSHMYHTLSPPYHHFITYVSLYHTLSHMYHHFITFWGT